MVALVLEALQGDIAADGIKRKDGGVIVRALRERGVRGDLCDEVVSVENRTDCAVGADEGERLDIGEGMVEPSADAADDHDLACAAVQGVFYAEHGVRIVLDGGEAEDLFFARKLILMLGMVKISDDGVGNDSFLFRGEVRGIRADDEVCALG